MKVAAAQPVIRDKEFAKRLERACELNPNVPTDGQRAGKQKWVYDSLAERFGVRVSPEGVRKWFSGESRPRPKIMTLLAVILEVDEAWLSLGIQPDETPLERQKRNAVADGAVNYVAGLIQLGGYNIAFPEPDDEAAPDLFAIIRGKQHSIEVKHVKIANGKGSLRVRGNRTIIAVIDTGSPMAMTVARVPADVVEKHGKRRGGYTEMTVEPKGATWAVGGDIIQKLRSFEDLNSPFIRAKSSQGSSAV